jgi:hypothetical protein
MTGCGFKTLGEKSKCLAAPSRGHNAVVAVRARQEVSGSIRGAMYFMILLTSMLHHIISYHVIHYGYLVVLPGKTQLNAVTYTGLHTSKLQKATHVT